jgi:SAM-dependent methyltransferase
MIRTRSRGAADLAELNGSDILVRHLARVPAHRALIRTLEHRLFAQETVTHPVLDIGCGDGHFAAVAFGSGVDVGIDVAESIVREAKLNGPYAYVSVASGAEIPFSDCMFRTVLSNCAVEHMLDIDSVVGEVARVLKPGGRFIFTVPNDHFTEMLFTVRMLKRIGFNGLAEQYGLRWNKRAAHHHLDGPDAWRGRLTRSGLTVDAWISYMSPGATRVFELAHYFAVPSLAVRWLTGRWVIWPARVQSSYAHHWLKPYAEEPWPATGSCSFFVAHK